MTNSNELKIVLNAVNNSSGSFGEVNNSLTKLGNKATSTVTNKLKPLNNALGIGLKAATGIGIAGVAGLAAALGKSIGSAGDMEQQMADVAAVLRMSTDEIGPLKDLAKNLGVDPKLKVSAVDAGRAIEMLAKNGVTMEQIMSGAARSTVLLSNATNADFAVAADVATDAMKLFNISADDMNTAVNGIASVTTGSKFDINDYKLAIANAGGMAKITGVSFDDMNAALVATSSAFDGGSDAGTSFKTFLTNIQPKAKEAEDKMKELGLMTEEGANQFFHANGELKSMAEIAGLLNKAVSGLTEQQRSNALETIFGADAIRTAGEMAGYTEKEFLLLQQTMSQTDASEMAATRVNTFKGALEILKSVISGVSIEVGEIFLPVLTSLSHSFSNLVANNKDKIINFFTDLLEKGKFLFENFNLVKEAVKQLISHFVTFNFDLYDTTDAIAEVLEGLGFTSETANNVATRIATLSGKWQTFVEKVKSLVAPIATAVGGIVSWDDAFASLGTLITMAIIPSITSIGSTIAGIVAVFAGVTLVVGAVRTAWETDWGGIKTTTMAIINALLEGYEDIKNGTRTMKQVASDLFGDLLESVSGLLPIFTSKLLEWGNVAWAWISDSTPIVLQKLVDWWDVIRGWVTNNVGTWANTLANWSQKAWEWISNPTTLNMLTSKLWEWKDHIFNWVRNQVPSSADFIEWSIGIVEWITDAAPKGIENLTGMIASMVDWLLGPGLDSFMGGVGDMFSKVSDTEPNSPASRLKAALLTMLKTVAVSLVEGAAGIGWAVVSGIANAFIPGAETVTNAIETFVGKMWAKFKEFLGIRSPSTIAFDIGTNLLQGFVNGINSKTWGIVNHLAAIGGDFVTSIKNAVTNSSLYQNGKDMLGGFVNGFNYKMDNFKIGFGGLISNMKGSLSYAISNNSLYSAGSEMVNGLINGFNQTMDNFNYQHLPSVADNVISNFKGLFGISSPSKVFHGFGVNLMEGLSNGVMSSLGMAVGATELAGTSVTNAASNMMMNNGNVTNNNNKNINISLGSASSGYGHGSNQNAQAVSLLNTLKAVGA